MLIFKKEKQVGELIFEYLREVRECLIETRDVLEAYVAGDIESAHKHATLVVEIESKADVLERRIREVLLDGAFLPNIRSDIYRLVEAVDAIAGKSESIARFISNQSPEIPEEFEADLLDIFRLSLDCFLELRKALKAYFKPKGKLENLHEHVAKVCDIETQVDIKESELSKKIFQSQMDFSRKIHLQQLVRIIGNIADLSEDASDELEFAALKSVV